MRVLQLSARNIWPLNTGAKLREFYLAREVARVARVTYAGFWNDNERPEEPCPALEQLPGVERIVMVPKARCYTPWNVVRGLAGTPVTILNYTTRPMADALRGLLSARPFDVAQIEGVHVFAYIPFLRRAGCRIVCDWHNIESELLRRYSDHHRRVLRRVYARLTARRLEEYERRLLKACDWHVVPSERERQRLLALVPGADVRVVENGVDAGSFGDSAPLAHSARRRILFAGSMDYHANIDGALWFARNVWPELRRILPGTVFTIAGRRPDPDVRSLADRPGVEVTGTVEDIRPYYRDAIAAVVPLRVGSGTRLKIPEAMAAGVPVISTALGAEGLDLKPGAEISIARTPDEWAREIRVLLEDERRWAARAEAGRRLARERFDWTITAAPLLDVYQGLAAKAKAAVAK